MNNYFTAAIETAFYKAVNKMENKDYDESVIWNFVDADMYMDVFAVYMEDEMLVNYFYDVFNTLATEYDELATEDYYFGPCYIPTDYRNESFELAA